MFEHLIHTRLDAQGRRRVLPSGVFRTFGGTEVFEDLGRPADDLREAVLDPRWDELITPRLAAAGIDSRAFREQLLTT